MASDAILAAVHRIYESALAPGGWSDAMLGIAAALDSDQACLIRRDTATGAVSSITGFAEAGEFLTPALAANDASPPPHMYSMCPGTVQRTSARRLPQYPCRNGPDTTILQTVRGRFAITEMLQRVQQNEILLAVSRDDRDYNTGEVAALQMLAPHLITGWRIWLKLRQRDGTPARAGKLPASPGTLERQFGLTPAEAALSLEIARGLGRSAAAKECGISVSTARTHLSRIFRKTGTHRQAELVRVILSHPAP